MILAKSCHDMDVLFWLVNAKCDRVSSFGELMHFKSENAPKGAPKRCMDGCPAQLECPYYAPGVYLTEKLDFPVNVISLDQSLEARTKAIETGPYGRCVYHCDNNVVDHQVVNMQFKNGVTVAFTMCAFTDKCSRTIKIMGTKGEVRAVTNDEIEITDFLTGSKETIILKKPQSGHGGGDYGLMRDFVWNLQNEDKIDKRQMAYDSIQSHVMAFAAEDSRLKNKVVDLSRY